MRPAVIDLITEDQTDRTVSSSSARLNKDTSTVPLQANDHFGKNISCLKRTEKDS